MPRAAIKATCETIEREDGSKDVVVSVPLIQLKGQVSDQQWQEIKEKLVSSKYAAIKEKATEAEWEEFVDALVNEKYKVRGKTLEDAKNRAYRIAEKYGAHLEFQS